MKKFPLPLFLCLLLLVGVVSANTVVILSQTDGRAYVGGLGSDDYGVYRNASGTDFNKNDTTWSVLIRSGLSLGKYYQMMRGIVYFNTSIVDTGTVDSATVSLIGQNKNEDLGRNISYGITGFTPTAYGNIVIGDYQRYTQNIYSTNITWFNFFSYSWDNLTPNVFTFSSLGIASINKTGTSAYMVRDSWDMNISDSGKAWSGSSVYTMIQIRSITMGSTNAPFMTITYTPAVPADTTPPASITSLANLTTCESVQWNWTKPGDADFNHTYSFRNNVHWGNLTNFTNGVNWTGLSPSTMYNISTKTVDIVGNMNATWVNASATTSACGSAPVSNFSANRTSVCIYDTILFSDTSSNSPTIWHYLFGDSQDSHLQNPTHFYDVMGSFNVSLFSENIFGNNTHQKNYYINVSSCIVENVSLSADSIGITYIRWKFSNTANYTYASLDGEKINLLNSSSNYTASDLSPDSLHTFILYYSNTFVQNTTRTLTESQTETDILINYIFIYLFFIVALGCIIIGLKIPFIALIGSGFAILGILDTIISQWFISFIFMCIFSAGIFVAFSKE